MNSQIVIQQWGILVLGYILPIVVVAGQLNGPHHHGIIDVVVYKNNDVFELELITPSHHIVGFESAPYLSEEKIAVRNGLDLLRKPEKLFQLLEDTQCEIDQRMIDISSEMIDFHRHKPSAVKNRFFANLLAKNQEKIAANKIKKEGVNNDVHSVGVDGHSDFRMYYKLVCKRFGKLSLKGFFDELKGVEKIDFHDAYWDGAVYLSLTPNQPELNMTYFSDSAEVVVKP